MINLTKEEAKKFILLKHALLGSYSYNDENDIVKIVNSLGCIQFDPVDVCGTNPQLVLQSRIFNFKKEMLENELYKNRSLIEYFDKNLAIFDINDYVYFNRIRNRFKIKLKNDQFIFDEINQYLDQFSYISSKDIKSNTKIDWFWNKTSIVRATLEAMYYRGDIVIHHRNKSIRFFSKTENIIHTNILNTKDFDNDFDYLKFRVKRRIKGVGLLWNRASDAFLYIQGLNTEVRKQIFKSLCDDDLIKKVKIEGFKDIFYIDNEDIKMLDKINITYDNRLEFIAPLDNLLWDRKLIKLLFNFDYKWEIYTKPDKRKYGYYTLPVLYNSNFVARIEIIAKRSDFSLLVNNIWLEEDFIYDYDFKKLLEERLKRFMIFNDCNYIEYSKTYLEKIK